MAKKHRLAIDAWGADDSQIRDVYKPLTDLIVKEVPEEYRNLYPSPVWKLTDRIGRLSRNILVSEFLVKEWAEHFKGKSEEELDVGGPLHPKSTRPSVKKPKKHKPSKKWQKVTPPMDDSNDGDIKMVLVNNAPLQVDKDPCLDIKHFFSEPFSKDGHKFCNCQVCP